MKQKRIIGIIARLLVGLVFIASTVTKYMSLEAVDIFVYEHQIFSWEITTFATRLLITLECFVGFMLLLGIYPKLSKWAAIIMLALFTIYVLLKPVLFSNVDTENCHCFGTVLLLSDTQTIIKNIILLIVSYFMFWDKGVYKLNIEKEKRANNFLFSHRKYISVIAFIVILIAANTITMPEPMQRKFFPKTASIEPKYFDVLFSQKPSSTLTGDKAEKQIPLFDISADSITNLGATQGKKIVCMFSTGCKYCKRTMMRLDVIRQKYNIEDTSFAIVFWGNEKGIDKFWKKTQVKPLPHTLVPPIPFLLSTKGKQPIIVLMNNGKIEKMLKYPNINEKDISEFLDKK